MKTHQRLLITTVIATLLLIPVVYATAVKIDNYKNRNSLPALTAKVLDTTSDYSQATNKEDKARLLNEAVTVAEQRKQVMFQLMDTNPQAAINQAMPEITRAQLPAPVKAKVEQSATVTGYLNVLHADDFIHKVSKIDSSITTSSNQHVNLRFVSQPEVFQQAGNFTRTHGVKLDNKMAVPAGGLVVIEGAS